MKFITFKRFIGLFVIYIAIIIGSVASKYMEKQDHDMKRDRWETCTSIKSADQQLYCSTDLYK